MNNEEYERALAHAKEQTELHAADDDGDEGEIEITVAGVDDFKVDEHGGIWCAGERIGGPDVIDDYDPNTDSAVKNLGLSPRERQLVGERTRDESGRFVGVSEPEEDNTPLLREACPSCNTHANMRMVHPSGAAWDSETGQSYVTHQCKCGEELLTEADGIPDSVQAKAIEEAEILNEILENHMERPPKP